MVEFKNNDVGELFIFKDGELISEITDPAVLWDTETNQILQVGDKKHVLTYYKTAMEVCKKHGETLFYYWVVRELPKSAELLNRILQHPEEIKHFEKEEDSIA